MCACVCVCASACVRSCLSVCPCMKDNLTAARSLEFVWKGSSQLPLRRSAIPTHIMSTHSGYSSPKCFDWRWDPLSSTITCPPVNNTNVQDLSDQYVELKEKTCWRPYLGTKINIISRISCCVEKFRKFSENTLDFEKLRRFCNNFEELR